MTDHESNRRAELIAAALTGDLTPDERTELDALRSADPTIDSDLVGLGAAAGRMSGALADWNDAPAPAALRDRVMSAGGGVPAEPRRPAADEPSIRSAPSRRRERSRWLLPVTAAACLALGLGSGVVATNAIANIVPSGTPGTLGAVEDVRFEGAPAGVTIDGSLVAHTWGTETLLEIDGLPVGESYSVFVVGESGERYAAGSFLGSAKTVDCQMNSAVMRADASSVAIEDADGDVVAAAELPGVSR